MLLGRTFETIANGITPIVRVMQWNVLADGLAALCEDNGNFLVEREAITMERRWPLFQKEIEDMQPHVVTLQVRARCVRRTAIIATPGVRPLLRLLPALYVRTRIHSGVHAQGP
jgi:hypothetical protein